MTKHDILEHFKDINYAYNNSNQLDTLSDMIDELLEEQHKAVSPGCRINRLDDCKVWTCGECGRDLVPYRVYRANYCSNCGTKVKWND